MHLLIVEDDEKLAGSLKRGLELKGYAVDWIVEPEKARTRILLYRNEYQLIFLDLDLAGELTGGDILKEVRSEGVTTPIVILTGEGTTGTKVSHLNSGADDYVVKPFSFDELLARVNSILRRPATVQALSLSVGSLTMDTSARVVRAGESSIPLTLKEYSLLECFLRRPGEVLTREELFNQIWDFNSVSWSNVLDVHMKNLRKKINGYASDIRFETVRGVGYRLAA